MENTADWASPNVTGAGPGMNNFSPLPTTAMVASSSAVSWLGCAHRSESAKGSYATWVHQHPKKPLVWASN